MQIPGHLFRDVSGFAPDATAKTDQLNIAIGAGLENLTAWHSLAG